MDSTDRDQGRVGRRGLVTGMLAGLGVAALTLGGRKARAKNARGKAQPQSGPVLYHRTAEADRYLKTLY